MTSHARTVTPTPDPLPGQAEAAIRVENIVKKYGDFEAVKGVSFRSPMERSSGCWGRMERARAR